jgi:hypothetical protein
VDALATEESGICAGGPDTFSFNELAGVAFSVLERRAKISHLPGWLIDLTMRLVKPFSARYHDLGAFFATVCRRDFVAPAVGTHRLRDYYRALRDAEED